MQGDTRSKDRDFPVGVGAGILTLDFLLHVVVPGGLIFFLVDLVFPGGLEVIVSSSGVGVIAFLVAGFLSYSIYRAVYLAGISRLVCGQLTEARRIANKVAGKKLPWIIIRALYIEWRELRFVGDLRADYVRRLAPYVHASYQSALIFTGFASVAWVAGGRSELSNILGLSGAAFFAAAVIEDWELSAIESDLLRVSEAAFAGHVRQTLFPAGVSAPQPGG